MKVIICDWAVIRVITDIDIHFWESFGFMAKTGGGSVLILVVSLWVKKGWGPVGDFLWLAWPEVPETAFGTY